MIVILGICAGLGAWSLAVKGLRTYQPEWEPTIYDWLDFSNFMAVVAAWTLVALRLRSPRPPKARLWRQPGFVACFSIASAWLFSYLVRLLSLVYPDPILIYEPVHPFSIGLIQTRLMPMSCAVASAWALLLISGRWKPEPTWLDRAGRILAILLISKHFFWAFWGLMGLLGLIRP